MARLSVDDIFGFGVQTMGERAPGPVPAGWPDRAIGPRRVGGYYWCRYWQTLYRVDEIVRATGDWRQWSVTVTDVTGQQAGESRTHCTAWEYGLERPGDAYRADRVVWQPPVD